MWGLRSLFYLTMSFCAFAYASSPIDPSIDSLPNSTATGATPATGTTTSSSSTDLGAQAQQNTATAMKTFQNVTYKKLSQGESDQNYNSTPPTSFPTKSHSSDSEASTDSSSYDNSDDQSGYE